VAIGPEGLKTWQISERVQVITTNEPLPDPQSNAQFARSMGFDEQMIQRLFGPAPASATGTAVAMAAAMGSAQGAGMSTLGELVAGVGQPASFTVSAEAAKAMASLGAASATSNCMSSFSWAAQSTAAP
jgi:hypothetical protein